MCGTSAPTFSPLPPSTNSPPRYVDTLGDVAAFAACLHLLPSPPAAVCIDDISSLPPEGPRRDRRAMDGAVSRTLALLHDGLAGTW